MSGTLRCAALCVALLSISGCLGAKPTTASPTDPGFHPTACRDDYSFTPRRVECGRMVVEETRGAGNGRRVSFPVVVLHALRHRKTDPVIYLHGGPGGWIVDGLAQKLHARELPVTEDRDWIFFDQRGTGGSDPDLDCGSLDLSDIGLSSAEAVDDARECGARLQARGIDLSQYNSRVVAEDLAELRGALKIRRYDLYAVSFGARVALEVMRSAPRGLRGVVLDSPWTPEANWTEPLPGLVSRQLRDLLTLCANDDSCRERHPNLGARFDDWLTVWLSAPPRHAGHRYSADEVAAYVLDALYDDDGARRLPQHLEQLMAGDLSLLDAFLQDQSGYVEGVFFATLCREELPFESAQAVSGGEGHDPLLAATARATRRLFAACEGFPVGSPLQSQNQPVHSAIPTLILAAQIDAGCPRDVAETAARGLRDSQLVIMPNMTHAPGERSPCAKRMIADFLDRPKLPVDASCVARDRPRFPFRDVIDNADTASDASAPGAQDSPAVTP